MGGKWGRRYISLTESVLSSYGFVYTFVALYMITNILLFLNAAISESKLHDDFQRYTTSIARGAGATLNFNMAVVLLLASRSALGILRETPLNMVLPIDKAMPDFHRVVGLLIAFAGLLHSVTHWVTYAIKKPWAGGYNGATSLFASGMALLLLTLMIRIVARSSVYHSKYELFFRFHVGGSVFIYAILIIHGLHNGIPSSWKWVLGPIVIYVFDVSFRSFREKRSYLLLSKHSAALQGPDIVKIRLPRVFHFQAGQYAELKVPQLSKFQWHPFTIASAPHEAEMVFYIKAVGDWTGSLHQLFGENINAAEAHDIEVHIRGPYGAPAQHVGQFDRVILVGGGVGATPFCSVVKDAYNWITNWTPRGRKRRQRPREGLQSPHREEGEKRRFPSSAQTNDTHSRHDDHSQSENYLSAKRGISHFFPTNVFTEQLDSVGDIEGLREVELEEAHAPSHFRQKKTETRNTEQYGSVDITVGETSMYTARDYLLPLESSSSGSTLWSARSGASSETSLRREKGAAQVFRDEVVRVTADGAQADETKASSKRKPLSKLSRRFSRSERDVPEDGMGTYHENSAGTYRRSLDYMSALHSAYLDESMNEVFQQSLDLMVSMSFGSATLIRNMQLRKAQRNLRRAPDERLPVTVSMEDLSLFHSPRIMFLLFMRSVTVNMVLLWILMLRFIIAGVAYVFGGFDVFDEGIALYSSPVLIAVDLLLAVGVTFLVGIPSIMEMLELAAAPLNGFDLFVLTPAAMFGVVVDIVALAGAGSSVNLFKVFHVFVVWPILTVLVMIRLLRVIGERIAQVENLTTTHSSTKAVDFIWTAPTAEDDQWLVSELSPYSDIESVQMHRYLTRCDDPGTRGQRRRNGKKGFLHTKYGRPEWMGILNEVAEKCPNNTTIGVFFCGPHSMGAQVQEACLSAMRNSIVRGLHSGARAMRNLEEVFGEAITANEYTGESSKPGRGGTRGCNVKIVFKRESFA